MSKYPSAYMKWKNLVKVILGLVITIICVGLAIRKVPLNDLTQIISGGNYYWAIPAVIAQLLAILFRSQRWVVLLERDNILESSILSQGIGYLFTNLLPFRLGEVARVLVMSERITMPVAQVAATAIVERLFDVGTMVLALSLILPWMQVFGTVIRSGEIFGALVLLGFFIIFLLARYKGSSFIFIDRVCAVFPVLPKTMILARWTELIEGLTTLLHGFIALEVIGLSILSWFFSGVVFFCSILIFQPAGHFLEAVFMMVSLSFAVIVPSSPGFIGVFQFIGQQALVIPFGMKYSASNALAIALMAHLIYYFLSTLLGLIGIWHFGHSFAGLMKLITREGKAEIHV